LVAALERCKNHRFTTYWTTRSPLGARARSLATHRRAQELTIRDAHSFFVDLQQKIDALERLDRPHPISVNIAVERVKQYVEDGRAIDLYDLVVAEVERLYAQLGPDEFPAQDNPANLPTKERFLERLER
jgi:transposase